MIKKELKHLFEKLLKFCQNELVLILVLIAVFWCLIILCSPALANIPRLPGTNQMDKLTAVGSLLRLVDSFLFTFGCPTHGGPLYFLVRGGTSRNQRFGIAVFCVLAAIVIRDRSHVGQKHL